jgi:hypothetical protein
MFGPLQDILHSLTSAACRRQSNVQTPSNADVAAVWVLGRSKAMLLAHATVISDCISIWCVLAALCSLRGAVRPTVVGFLADSAGTHVKLQAHNLLTTHGLQHVHTFHGLPGEAYDFTMPAAMMLHWVQQSHQIAANRQSSYPLKLLQVEYCRGQLSSSTSAVTAAVQPQQLHQHRSILPSPSSKHHPHASCTRRSPGCGCL